MLSEKTRGQTLSDTPTLICTRAHVGNTTPGLYEDDRNEQSQCIV